MRLLDTRSSIRSGWSHRKSLNSSATTSARVCFPCLKRRESNREPARPRASSVAQNRKREAVPGSTQALGTQLGSI